MMKQRKGELILLLAALLWGTCFAFQKMGMDYVGPYTLGTFRFLLGAMILLLPLLVWEKKKIAENPTYTPVSFRNKSLLSGGILCGISLFCAASLQQIGLQYTTAGKAGFITSMEIVLVAFAMILISKKIQINIIFSIFFAVIGMYFLCITESFSLQKGDLFELAGVLFWSVQLLLIDYYAKNTDVLKLSFIQFMTTGLLSFLFMLLFEHPQVIDIKAGLLPILYTAIIEVAIAYTLQIIGQKYAPPVISAIILSLEAVFSVISGSILLGENLTSKELVGCSIMFLAVIVSQLPSKSKIRATNLDSNKI